MAARSHRLRGGKLEEVVQVVKERSALLCCQAYFMKILLAIFGPLIVLFVLIPTAVLTVAWVVYGIVMALRELWKDD